MSSRFRSLVALAVLALAAPLAVTINAGPAAAAPTVPDGFTNLLAASSLGLAVDLTTLPDGRLLVAAQDGQVWVIAANGTTVSAPAVTLTGLCRSGEQGLLGVEADPAFAGNHYIYVYAPTARRRRTASTASPATP